MSIDCTLYVTVDGVVRAQRWLGQSGTLDAIHDLIASKRLKLIKKVSEGYGCEDSLIIDRSSLKQVLSEAYLYEGNNPLHLYVGPENSDIEELLNMRDLDNGVWQVVVG
jgi:hypothetical protein